MDLLTILIILLLAVMLGVMAMLYRMWSALQQPPAPPLRLTPPTFLLLQNQMKNLQDAVKFDPLEVVKGVTENKESHQAGVCHCRAVK